MSTIKDVARAPNVSAARVSRVNNQTRFVGPELVSTVPTVAELSYQPHRGAQSLQTRRTNSVGLVLPYISNPFFALLARRRR